MVERKQAKWQQRQQHTRSDEQQQRSEKEIEGVIVFDQLAEIKPILLDRLEYQDSETFNNSYKGQHEPELVKANTELDVSEHIEEDTDQGDEMADKPGKLRSLYGKYVSNPKIHERCLKNEIYE